MSIQVGDNFKYLGKKPLDNRTKYSTIAEMASMSVNTLYDGIIAYCMADGKNYQWKSTNSEDVTLGKWREFSTGGEVDNALSLLSENPVQNKKISEKIINTKSNSYNGIPFNFAIDDDGNYGYIKAGADTVTPFKTGEGSNYGGIIHLSTTNLQNKSITGTNGTDTVIGAFDSLGIADLHIPSDGNWTLTCDGNELTVRGFVFEQSAAFSAFDGIIYNNGSFGLAIGRNDPGATLTEYNSYFRWNHNGNGSIANKIYFLVDLTNYSLLKINYTKNNGSPWFGMAVATKANFNNTFGTWDNGSSTYYHYSPYTLQTGSDSPNNTSFSLDVSNLTGEYYVGFDIGISGSQGYVDVSKIWLE